MHPTIIPFRSISIIFVFIVYLAASAIATPTSISIDANGIRFTGSLGRPVPGSEEIWGEYYVEIIAENVGQKEQTLLLGQKPKTDGSIGTVLQSCYLRTDRDGSYFKPILSDLRPLLLKPGERAIIAECSIVLAADTGARVYSSNRNDIVYIFSVEEETKKFYDAWTGRVELRFPLVRDREKAASPPKAVADPKTIEHTNIPWAPTPEAEAVEEKK